MTARHAYSSVVFSRGHLAVGVVLAVLVAGAIRLVVGASLWVAFPVGAVLLATAAYVSTVRLVLGADQISVGLGPLARPGRLLDTASVAEARAADLSLPEVFGPVCRGVGPTPGLPFDPGRR